MIYGWRGAKIGSFDVPDTVCGHCDNHAPQRVTVFGKYVHVLWIPVFPTGKTKVAECMHCMRTIEENDFPSDLRANVHHYSGQVKRPIWHFLGLILIAGFIGLSTIIGVVGSILSDDTPDPRADQLNAFEGQMVVNPVQEMDSTAYTLKAFFGDFVSEDLDISKNEYFSKVKDDKLMILVRMPELKRLEKTARPQVIEMIEMLVDADDGLKDKKRYIGVFGKYTLMLLKTPAEEDNSRLAISTPLLDFFGAKPLPPAESK